MRTLVDNVCGTLKLAKYANVMGYDSRKSCSQIGGGRISHGEYQWINFNFFICVVHTKKYVKMLMRKRESERERERERERGGGRER